jgi:MFS transporter, ACS family, tartrate transporter
LRIATDLQFASSSGNVKQLLFKRRGPLIRFAEHMTQGAERVDRLGDRLMAIFWRKPAATLAERTRRRVTLHIVPFLFFLYILAYIDRMNIAVAKLGMTEPLERGGLGFDNAIIGFGTSIFFIGYWILEIPSTLWVERRGARWVFVRILVLWGLMAGIMAAIGTPVAAAMFGWLPHLNEGSGFFSGAAGFVNGLGHDPKCQFYFFRFMLGFFEGGFFPSVIVFFSHWFRPEDRARAMASFALAMPLSSVVGYPVSVLIKNNIAWFGIEGWRWIFIVEGIIPVLAGIATIYLLPDRPSEVKWLTNEEREWLSGELEREKLQRKQLGHFGWHNHLAMILLLTAVYFCTNVTAYGFSTFMPTIMQSYLSGLPEVIRSWFGLTGKPDPQTLKDRQDFAATILATLPYCMSMLALLFNGWHSDKTRERTWHAAIPMAMGTVGVLLVWLCTGQPLLAILVIIFVLGACLYTHIPAFWPIPTMFLGASAAASAIGFINMIGNLGSFLGPNVIGEKADTSIPDALLRIAPWSIAGAAILVATSVFGRRRMRRNVEP